MSNRILAAVIATTAYLISNPQTLLGQEPQLTVRVLVSFDYPGSGNSTTVQGINDSGDVTGYFEDSSGAVRSFIRFADGTFSAPIVEPNDTGNITVAKDINNSGAICGYYFSSDIYYPYRGFILVDTTFTEYGPGGSDYYLTGINDAGDFCATLDFHYLVEGLLQLADGRGVIFNVGNSAEANAVNVHDAIVGNWTGSDSSVHGFLRQAGLFADRIISPVDYPGATQTYLFGLNDDGRHIVGKYVDSVGATHGLILQRPLHTPDIFSSFDYPGATETSLNGVNNLRRVSGYYADSSGTHHGFIGKLIESH
jgi:hypothetical protein